MFCLPLNVLHQQTLYHAHIDTGAVHYVFTHYSLGYFNEILDYLFSR